MRYASSYAGRMGPRTAFAKIKDWLSVSWTIAERALEEDEVATIRQTAKDKHDAFALFGVDEAQDRARIRHRARRLRLRLIGGLTIIVAVFAFVSAFTPNALVHGVMISAVASAAPVALYLGLRRD
jgi:hypothetical protein